MGPELDLTRLTELQRALGAELTEIIARLISELEQALAEIEQALAQEDLSGAAHAAHAGRNSALMVGAGPTLDALGEIESAARGGHLGAASAGLERLRMAWPTLRHHLELAADQSRPQRPT